MLSLLAQPLISPSLCHHQYLFTLLRSLWMYFTWTLTFCSIFLLVNKQCLSISFPLCTFYWVSSFIYFKNHRGVQACNGIMCWIFKKNLHWLLHFMLKKIGYLNQLQTNTNWGSTILPNHISYRSFLATFCKKI